MTADKPLEVLVLVEIRASISYSASRHDCGNVHLYYLASFACCAIYAYALRTDSLVGQTSVSIRNTNPGQSNTTDLSEISLHR